MSYKELLDKIGSENSKNYKQHILEVHQEDKTLKRILAMALDPFLNFFINKKIPKVSPGNGEISLSTALDMLCALSDRKVTGNAAMGYLANILSKLTEDDADVILRVVRKKLRCGVAAGIVNAVWPGLVFSYPCMLCESFDIKLFNKIKGPFYVQTKEDGGRFNAIVKNGTCKFFTRNGNQFFLDSTTENLFITLAGSLDIVFDGELLVRGEKRQAGNGKLNKAIKGTISQEEIDSIYFSLWDTIPYNCFTREKCNAPYSTRLETLKGLLEINPNSRLRLVKTDIIDSLDAAGVIYQDNLLNDLEGIVIKDMHGPWENKRVQYNLKMKAEKDCDLLCTGILPGEVGSKYENCIGTLVCQTSDGLLNVNVGSGLKDIDRVRTDFPGSIVWVKYNEKIMGDDGWSLFLPIFKGIRVDKDIADSLEDIK